MSVVVSSSMTLTAETVDSRTGVSITRQLAMAGVFTYKIQNPLYFKILENKWYDRHKRSNIEIQIQFNHNLRKALGLHKCFLNFQVWTALRPQTGLFLKVFKREVLRRIDWGGVLCINTVVSAVDTVLYRVFMHTISVHQTQDVMEKLY